MYAPRQGCHLGEKDSMTLLTRSETAIHHPKWYHDAVNGIKNGYIVAPEEMKNQSRGIWIS